MTPVSAQHLPTSLKSSASFAPLTGLSITIRYFTKKRKSLSFEKNAVGKKF